MELRDKVAIVTGASSGIGEAVAMALASRGARLTLTARRQARLEKVAERIRADGGEVLVVPADVRSEPELTGVFESSQVKWGRLDVLVNSAGLGRAASLHDGATEHWREMLEVNVLALSIATRDALRRFDPEGSGHIIHISSLSGHRVPPKGGFYPATKSAVRALTEALRLEMRERGSRHRVSSVSPGFVDTGFIEGYHHGDAEKARATRARCRFLDPADVARSVIHALEAPDHVAVHDVLVRCTEQPT